jgi:hypothetical protein
MAAFAKGHIKVGGRRRGVPNKTSAKRAIAIAASRRTEGKRLAVDVLSELMHYFMGLAAKHQPRMANGVEIGSEDKFTKFAKLAADIAKDLASYESPKLQATTMRGDPDQPLEAKLEIVIVGKDGARSTL